MDLDANSRALAFAQRARERRIDGVTDVVASLAAVGLHYRPDLVRRAAGESPLAAMKRIVSALLDATADAPPAPRRLVTIPVHYGGDSGPDLESCAQALGLAPDELVALHTATEQRVLMLGFSPGFPYMGFCDERLSIGRRATPRTRVPERSLAIANRQTAIYPFATPGGWHLIGRTPWVLFDPLREPACLLEEGDRVRFEPIDAATYEAMLTTSPRAEVRPAPPGTA